MVNQPKKLFREESLQRANSPEQLDKLMEIVNPMDWIPLGGMTILLGLLGVWSVWGRIPIYVNGQGVLILPRQVIQFQTPVSGQLESIFINGGQIVKKDQIIATINPSDLKQQLQQQQEKLTRLAQQQNRSVVLSNQRTQVEKNAIALTKYNLEQQLTDAQLLTPLLRDQTLQALAQQRQALEQRLKDTQSSAPILQDKAVTAIVSERNSLKQQLQDTQDLIPKLKERFERRQNLLASGAISQDTLFETEQQYIQGLQKVSQLESQLQQLEVKETETNQQYLNNQNTITQIQAQLREITLEEVKAKQAYLDNLNKISKLQAEIQELNTRSKRLDQENIEKVDIRFNEYQQTQHQIAQLQKQIKDKSQIKSPVAGTILEVTATIGQSVTPGTRLGSIQSQTPNQQTVVVSYFSIKEGKQIKPGMSIQVTPDKVQRERFGGIIGKVISVSPFPVTREGVSSVIGNPDLTMQLLGNQSKIEVISVLEKDPTTVTGYKWSSSVGPNEKITMGTTTGDRVKVESRAPITFVLPILREWTGLN